MFNVLHRQIDTLRYENKTKRNARAETREMKNPKNSLVASSMPSIACMWPPIPSVLLILAFNRKLLFGVFPCFMSTEKIFDLMANALSINTCERINKLLAREIMIIAADSIWPTQLAATATRRSICCCCNTYHAYHLQR